MEQLVQLGAADAGLLDVEIQADVPPVPQVFRFPQRLVHGLLRCLQGTPSQVDVRSLSALVPNRPLTPHVHFFVGEPCVNHRIGDQYSQLGDGVSDQQVLGPILPLLPVLLRADRGEERHDELDLRAAITGTGIRPDQFDHFGNLSRFPLLPHLREPVSRVASS